MSKKDIKKSIQKCWQEVEKPSEELFNLLFTDREGYKNKISLLKRDNVNKPAIFVGTGTCGLGAGAEKTIGAVKKFVNYKNINADIVEVGCIGLCSSEPLVDVQLPGKNRVSFQNITEEKVEDVLEAIFSGEIKKEYVLGQFRNEKLDNWKDVRYLDEHPFFAQQTRWVLKNCGIINPLSIDEYIARGGYASFYKTITQYIPEEFCEIVEKSGLRGRGGGGFPTGTKWKIAAKTEADQKYLICNADEGDPGAFMDRAVIEGDPYRLLEGMAIAAYGVGATKAYVYIRAEYPLAIERLENAIEQAKKYRLLGEDILDSGFNFDIIIKKGAGAFVCGEETALINSIEGKRGMPKPRPPYPAVKGLFNKPTVINNVETLSNIPLLINKGAEWFASFGTDSSHGTKVFAISGKVKRTGLIEVEMGTTIKEIVFNVGGGIDNEEKFKAVQIGGPSGGCIPLQHIDTEVDYEKLKKVGAMMGSGGLVVMDQKTCMVDVAKFFMDFIQRESCGKCIPCREGTKRMLEILESITRGRSNESEIQALERFQGIMLLENLAEVIKETSLCGLGQTAPNPVLSTLRWFKDEYEAHIYERRCPAGVCKDLLVYKIDGEKCIGCTKCAKNCPQEAIMGTKKSPHYIIQNKCIKCGICLENCPVDAITVE
jgi:NADH:ubiquinone oxidoreductase subunit F (NADH-binding)/NAD-dependent dihydropyrimidine dehydrogenase PreA subunit/(2Fe-2S) ferredoxin